MKNRLVVSDFYGVLMRVLLCSIVWYKEAIQNRYYRGSSVFLVLGALLTAVVFLDYFSKGKHGFLINGLAWRYLLYLGLTFVFGFVVAPNISNHISYGITVIEFSMIMAYICYYASTRGSVEFLVWNYM